MKVQVLLSLFMVLMMSSSGASQASYYCGNDLAEAVMNMCYQRTAKRSDLWLKTQIFGEGFWLSPRQAMKISNKKRGGGGIVQECCEQPCTREKILQYCYED